MLVMYFIKELKNKKKEGETMKIKKLLASALLVTMLAGLTAGCGK